MNLHATIKEIDVRVSTIPTVNGEFDQLASAQPQRATVWVRSSRSEQEAGTHHSPSARPTQRNHFAYRSHRLREIDLSLLLSLQYQLGAAAALLQSKNRSNIVCPASRRLNVKPEIDLTFAKGLRHIFAAGRRTSSWSAKFATSKRRTSPSVPRMTGHLVFSTLHTNDRGWRHHSSARYGCGAVPASLGGEIIYRPNDWCARFAPNACS